METQLTRLEIEHAEAANVAEKLFKRLPRSPKEIEQLMANGAKLGAQMNWDAVARDYVLPGMDRALKGKGGGK